MSAGMTIIQSVGNGKWVITSISQGQKEATQRNYSVQIIKHFCDNTEKLYRVPSHHVN